MSRILKDSIIYSAANLFAYVASIVRGIVVARLLGPATYGLSNIISMVADYGGFAQLGSHSAFFFKKTRLDARSEFKESEELQAITFSWTILVYCVLALVLILLSFLLSLGSVERWLLRIVGFYVLFQQCINLVVTVLQAERKLVEVGKIQALLGLFSAAAAIIATFYFGLVGLWGALLASSAIVLFFVLMGGRVKLHWAWNRRKIAVLLVYGLPIMIYGLLFYALLGVNRILVVVLLGQTSLGYYAIAVFFASFVIVLAQYFSNALLPHVMPLIEKNDEKGIKKYYSLYLYSASVFSALLIGLLYSFSFVILKLFLPAYLPALTSMKILLFASFFIALASLSCSLLLGMNKLARLTKLTLVAVGLEAVIVFALLQMGFGIEGGAVGTLVAYAFYAAAVNWSFFKKFGFSLVSAFKALLPVLYAAGVLCLIDTFLQVSFISSVLQASVFIALYAPLLFYFNKKTCIATNIKTCIATNVIRIFLNK